MTCRGSLSFRDLTNNSHHLPNHTVQATIKPNADVIINPSASTISNIALSLDLVTGIDSVKRPVRFGIWMGDDPLAIGEVWKSYGLAAAGDRLLG